MDRKERRRQGWINAQNDSNSTDDETEAVAASVVPPSERERAEVMGGAAEWVREEFDVEPAKHDSDLELMAAISAKSGEEGED